jgi:hypothetical protein
LISFSVSVCFFSNEQRDQADNEGWGWALGHRGSIPPGAMGSWDAGASRTSLVLARSSSTSAPSALLLSWRPGTHLLGSLLGWTRRTTLARLCRGRGKRGCRRDRLGKLPEAVTHPAPISTAIDLDRQLR